MSFSDVTAPGETEEQYLATEALVREVGFDRVNTAAYSPRPNTPAAEWEHQVRGVGGGVVCSICFLFDIQRSSTSHATICISTWIGGAAVWSHKARCGGVKASITGFGCGLRGPSTVLGVVHYSVQHLFLLTFLVADVCPFNLTAKLAASDCESVI